MKLEKIETDEIAIRNDLTKQISVTQNK